MAPVEQVPRPDQPGITRDGSAIESPDRESPIRVLIAEDEAHLGVILEQFLTARGFSVRVERDGRSALEALQRESFDVALLDVVMPEVDGLEVMRQVRERPVPPEIIVITGNGTIETAMAALRLGAYDVLSKPYRMAEIEALVRRAWEKRLLLRDRWYRAAVAARDESHDVLTSFAPYRAVLDMLEQFASSPLPVFITGEEGTGRQRIARRLHQGAAGGAFVRVDCAGRTDQEQLDDLFGPERPVSADPRTTNASGAGVTAMGALELASRGTLYLRDVEALGPRTQAALLAALDNGHVVTPGDQRRLPLTARIVASGARELTGPGGLGGFAEPLAHRLSAIRVHLPPLRDRGSDAVFLARQFLDAQPNGRHLHFAPAAIDAIERYPWPGNVRELRLAVERAAYRAADGLITTRALALDDAEHAGPAVPSATAAASPPARGGHMVADDDAPPSLADLERRHIAAVLDRSGWHQGRAAELLGISPKTLYRKIREFGFTRPSGRNA